MADSIARMAQNEDGLFSSLGNVCQALSAMAARVSGAPDTETGGALPERESDNPPLAVLFTHTGAGLVNESGKGNRPTVQKDGTFVFNSGDMSIMAIDAEWAIQFLEKHLKTLEAANYELTRLSDPKSQSGDI